MTSASHSWCPHGTAYCICCVFCSLAHSFSRYWEGKHSSPLPLVWSWVLINETLLLLRQVSKASRQAGWLCPIPFGGVQCEMLEWGARNPPLDLLEDSRNLEGVPSVGTWRGDCSICKVHDLWPKTSAWLVGLPGQCTRCSGKHKYQNDTQDLEADLFYVDGHWLGSFPKY